MPRFILYQPSEKRQDGPVDWEEILASFPHIRLIGKPNDKRAVVKAEEAVVQQIVADNEGIAYEPDIVHAISPPKP